MLLIVSSICCVWTSSVSNWCSNLSISADICWKCEWNQWSGDNRTGKNRITVQWRLQGDGNENLSPFEADGTFEAGWSGLSPVRFWAFPFPRKAQPLWGTCFRIYQPHCKTFSLGWNLPFYNTRPLPFLLLMRTSKKNKFLFTFSRFMLFSVASIDLTTPAIDFVTWNEVKEIITKQLKWAVSHQALLSLSAVSNSRAHSTAI